jgi:hypothetical protein
VSQRLMDLIKIHRTSIAEIPSMIEPAKVPMLPGLLPSMIPRPSNLRWPLTLPPRALIRLTPSLASATGRRRSLLPSPAKVQQASPVSGRNATTRQDLQRQPNVTPAAGPTLMQVGQRSQERPRRSVSRGRSWANSTTRI